MQELNNIIAQANNLLKQAWQARDEKAKIDLVVRAHDVLYNGSVEYYRRKTLEEMK